LRKKVKIQICFFFEGQLFLRSKYTFLILTNFLTLIVSFSKQETRCVYFFLHRDLPFNEKEINFESAELIVAYFSGWVVTAGMPIFAIISPGMTDEHNIWKKQSREASGESCDWRGKQSTAITISLNDTRYV